MSSQHRVRMKSFTQNFEANKKKDSFADTVLLKKERKMKFKRKIRFQGNLKNGKFIN